MPEADNSITPLPPESGSGNITPPPGAAVVTPIGTTQLATPGQPVVPGTEQSGTVSPTKAFFQSINWLEFGFMALGAAGLYFTIYYYRYKLKEEKVATSDLQRKMDEVQANVQSFMKGKYKPM